MSHGCGGAAKCRNHPLILFSSKKGSELLLFPEQELFVNGRLLAGNDWSYHNSDGRVGGKNSDFRDKGAIPEQNKGTVPTQPWGDHNMGWHGF